MTIVEFLHARYDEIEAAAKAATSGPWRWSHGYGEMCGDKECPYGQLMGATEDGTPVLMFDVHGGDKADAEHIARHDPAYVLADIEAKRELLAAFEATEHEKGLDWGFAWTVMKSTIYAHAAVFAGHPDYRQAWAT